jgi:chorismate mutase/prephenate dehydratase
MSEDPRAPLKEFRQQIDAIDLDVLELLNRRAAIAEKIGDTKRALGLEIIEATREQEVVENMMRANRGPLPADSVERIFLRVMREMRAIQRRRMEQAAGDEKGQ